MNTLHTVPELDSDGHLYHHQQWSEQIAQHLADTLGINLTYEHYQILHAVRDFYQHYGYAPTTRPLIKYLQKTVDIRFDNAFLMQLFQTGLVARHVNRIAGLPKPANCL